MRFTSCIYLIALLLVSSCSKEEAEPNPYAVEDSSDTITITEPDPASIVGLHKNIFVPRCANPGCHDGTFEPDFRTVQSAWSSLVYMTVNKQTVDSVNYFNYRVLPGDTVHSFLLERLTTPTSDYMPSNSVRLTSAEIQNIRNWIAAGAKDANGVIPVKPNLPPNVIGYIALGNALVRLDTVRLNNVSYYPFLVPANSAFSIPFLALDTADGSTATDPANFTVARIKFSLLQDDFSAATSINAVWFSPLPYAAWQVPVNAAIWPAGSTVYFRIYLNDGFQPLDVEFPRNSSPVYYKTYYAFLVQ